MAFRVSRKQPKFSSARPNAPTMVGRAERRRYAAHPPHHCGLDPKKSSPEVTNPPPAVALAAQTSVRCLTRERLNGARR
eukprot:4075802-Prymnesium_polylepis.1